MKNIFRKEKKHPASEQSQIINRALTNMMENAPAEQMLEGAKIITAAVSDAGVILRLDNGVKFMFVCAGGEYTIETNK